MHLQFFPTVTRHVTVAVISIYSADTTCNGGDPVTVIVVSEVVIRCAPVGAVALERGYVTVTTVGYLLGETEETNVLKDPTMLKRLNEISTLPDDDRHCIIYAIDGLLQNVRTKQAFG